jgi:hypothetical protein
MATRIKKKYDWAAPSSLTRTEKATYPWDEWLDGDAWRLVQGEDFHPHPLMMERIIRTRATGRSAKVRVRHLPLNGQKGTSDPTGLIVMERTDIDGPMQSKRAQKAAATRERRAAKKATAPAKAAAALEEAGLTSKAPAKKAPTKRAPSKKPANRK